MRFVLITTLLALACGCSKPPPPRHKREGNLQGVVKVPAFTFLEAHDQPFSLEDLKGKVWICSFIFTTCATRCPPMAMSPLQGSTIAGRIPTRACWSGEPWSVARRCWRRCASTTCLNSRSRNGCDTLSI